MSENKHKQIHGYLIKLYDSWALLQTEKITRNAMTMHLMSLFCTTFPLGTFSSTSTVSLLLAHFSSGKETRYTPVYPSFTIYCILGVYIERTCYLDDNVV